MTPRPAPEITPESKPYWDSIAAHAMKLQRCTRCETFRFYPTPVCPHCHSTSFTWEPVSGDARLYSYSVVHKPVTEAFEAEVPYVVALVTLAEGPTLMTNLLDVPEEEIEIGMALRIGYRDFEGFSLPVALRG
ncbi:MAG TPA: OB-fold domain-containing protein [Solirubrobacterales bacterium]|nr:OB-fold domain-containing protein [Solirubrobacterales bacterium]